ncbi:MAG: FAD:protein FMN transferase [Porticoccaceae bacterium]|nr:FAD:protein FMN transferase [Porticoccaceae bacterium]
MGTTYHITVIADQLPPSDIEQQIDQLLSKVDHSMSTYKKDSEISRFNRLTVGQQLEISQEFADVLQISREIWQLSEGAFDPTLGPLVDLWGFGPKTTGDLIPSDQAITAALKNTGFDGVVLKGLTLIKNKPVALDLSAVAKGYAVDLVSNYLEMNALPDYLVEVGGEIRVSGFNSEGTPWRVAIEQPQLLASVNKIVGLTDMSIATSGDYRNYFERDGIRYSHTINPKTGKPITHNLASVTVLIDSCAEADAWATAFSVLGPEQSVELAEKLDLAMYMLVRQNDQFVASSSRLFKSYIDE